jgi:hypothetical protein
MERTARDEMDSLLEALLSVAQQALEKRGEFYPVGAAVDSDGQIRLVAADVDGEHPESLAVIEGLYAGLGKQAAAGEIRGAAVCADVLITPPGQSNKTDAISVSIEHVDGDPVEVLLPYARRRLRGPEYGELFAQAGSRRVFT